jgi:hypothetical protein
MLIRLRVALADRPGALAQVATIIAGHSGNITSVDVQRVDAESAVDDLVVEFAEEPDLNALRTDIATNGGATVMSHQETQAADPIAGSLRRVADLLDAAAGDPTAALAQGVAELCSSPAVWVSPPEEAVRHEAGRLALEHIAAVALRTVELPDHLAERLPGDVILLAVPDPERLSGGKVVFVARQVDNNFTATEISRIEALTVLFSRVETLMAAKDQLRT